MYNDARPPHEFSRLTSFTDSSVVDAVAYDPEARTMRVYFKRNHAVWDYLDIPSTEYASLVAAVSPGAVYNERIRYRYEAVSITPLEAEGKREAPTKKRRGQIVMLDNYEGK